MHVIKVVSDRETVYRFASYIRVIEGIQNAYVEIGDARQPKHIRCFVHIVVEEGYDELKALRETARIADFIGFSYMHYRDALLEEAFESVKRETYEL